MDEDKTNSSSAVEEIIKEDLKDLSLIDNNVFLFAVDDNKKLADVLIRPALDYLDIKDYEIISVKSEVSYVNLKSHGVRIDCQVRLAGGDTILIEIQNGHPEKMPLKRIRYGRSSFDTKALDQGEDYTNLPDVISLIYTTEPLENYDTGHTINDLAVVDLTNGKVVDDYGLRIIIVNGKYKEEKFRAFSDVIEDLQQTRTEDVKNPVIKDIHLKIKNTEKGRRMLSDFIEKRYESVIQEVEEKNRKLQEQHLKDQEQLEQANEELKKYKNLLKEKGIDV